MKQDSKYMTLKELFQQLMMNHEAVISAMATANEKSKVLARQVGMNWRRSGWKDVPEEDKKLENVTWGYSVLCVHCFLFMKRDKRKVIRILKLKKGNEDSLLGATNE
jgi:hypothetical protein